MIYPNGIDPQDALFFNHEDIDKVVFRGDSEDEEERFLEVYEEWKKKLDEENQGSILDEMTSFGFEQIDRRSYCP